MDSLSANYKGLQLRSAMEKNLIGTSMLSVVVQLSAVSSVLWAYQIFFTENGCLLLETRLTKTVTLNCTVKS